MPQAPTSRIRKVLAAGLSGPPNTGVGMSGWLRCGMRWMERETHELHYPALIRSPGG